MTLVPSLISFVNEKVDAATRRTKQVKNIGVEVEFASATKTVEEIEEYLAGKDVSKFGGKPLEFTSDDHYFSGTEGKDRSVLIKIDSSASLDSMPTVRNMPSIEDQMMNFNDTIRLTDLIVSNGMMIGENDLTGYTLAKKQRMDMAIDLSDINDEDWKSLFSSSYTPDLDTITDLILSYMDEYKIGDDKKKDFIDYLEKEAGIKLHVDDITTMHWYNMHVSRFSDLLVGLDDDERKEKKEEIRDHWDKWSRPVFTETWRTIQSEQKDLWEKEEGFFYNAALAIFKSNTLNKIRGILEWNQATGTGGTRGKGIEIVTPRIAASDSNIESIFDTFKDAMDYAEGVAHDNAGIHVHFGLNQMFQTAHLIRLVVEIATRQEELEASAKRPVNDWAMSMRRHFKILQEGAQLSFDNKDMSHFIQSVQEIAKKLKDDRYKILNLTNVDSRKTIEFRLGSSYLMEAKNDFIKWVTDLRDLVNASLSDDWIYIPRVSTDDISESFAAYQSGDDATIRFRLEGGNNPLEGGNIEMQVKRSGEWHRHGTGGSDAVHALKNMKKNKPDSPYAKMSKSGVMPDFDLLSEEYEIIKSYFKPSDLQKIRVSVNDLIMPEIKELVDSYITFINKVKAYGKNEIEEEELETYVPELRLDDAPYTRSRVASSVLSVSPELLDMVTELQFSQISVLRRVSDTISEETTIYKTLIALIQVRGRGNYINNRLMYIMLIFTFAIYLEMSNLTDAQKNSNFAEVFPAISHSLTDILRHAEEASGTKIIGIGEESKGRGKLFANKRQEYRSDIAQTFGDLEAPSDETDNRLARRQQAKGTGRRAQLQKAHQSNLRDIEDTFGDDSDYLTFTDYLAGKPNSDPRPFLNKVSRKLPHVFGRFGTAAMESLMEDITAELLSTGVSSIIENVFGA